jgi:capsule polysaccharide export protein KpsE/RkpR
VTQLHGLVERLAFLSASLADARDQAKSRAAQVPDRHAVKARLAALADELDRQRSSLAASQRGEGISGEQRLREALGSLYGNVNGYEGPPTQSQLTRMAVLEEQLGAAVAAFDTAMAKQGAAVSAALAALKLPPITPLTREVWEARTR